MFLSNKIRDNFSAIDFTGLRFDQENHINNISSRVKNKNK